MKELKTVEDFKEVASGKCVVLVGSPTCQPCKTVAALLDSIPEEGTPFYKADVMEFAELFAPMRIMSIPTLLFMENSAIVDRCGMIGASDLKTKISKFKESN